MLLQFYFKEKILILDVRLRTKIIIIIPIALITFMVASMSIISYNSNLRSEKLLEKIESSHKCLIDSDCPLETPICLSQKYSIDDMAFTEYICFSKEEGNKVRDTKFQSCLKSEEKNYQDSLEKDGKIFEIRDPPSPHKANYVGGIVYFLPYMMNNLVFNPLKVLGDEYQLEIIRRGGIDSIVIVALPEGKEVETLCTLELDNRIREASSYIEWERVEP